MLFRSGGVIFIDLRDREGLVQVVCDPDNPVTFGTAEKLRSEFVVRVTGLVRERPAGTTNANLVSGEIEVLAREIAGQVGPSAKSAGRQVYVAPNTPPSPFNQGFHGMLVEALVNEGVSVAAAPAGALTLTYNVQVVQHAAQRAGFAGPASDPPTASEAIVSAQIVDAGRVAFRTNRVFYVN